MIGEAQAVLDLICVAKFPNDSPRTLGTNDVEYILSAGTEGGVKVPYVYTFQINSCC